MLENPSPANLADVSTFQKEWAALLECASPARDGARLAKLFAGVDWGKLLLLAEEHGVLAHVAAGLGVSLRLVLSDSNAVAVSPEVTQALLERQRAQNFQTLRLTAELFRILETFAEKKIPALVIKGPVLAMQAYGDPAMRGYGDLDLLVRQRDIRRATEAMLASGFAAAVPLRAIDAGKIPGQYLFSKPDSKLLVELHNDLTLRYFPRPLPIEDFFARQVCVRLDTHEAPALAVEDELVLICIHGAKHFWERLIWIADVAALVTRQTGMDWGRAEESARAVRAEHLLHVGLRLAGKLLRARLPEKVIADVKSDAAAGKMANKIMRWLPAAGYAPPGLFERAMFRMRMRGGVFAAPAYLLRLSLSPTEEDWQDEGQISRNRFLDMLRRPFRLARKHGRGGKP
ncbi:MAG TPA: nucleotidyltransferase family protein [Candidatus Angelobacter sp.]|nr:nucleotidyltransferase family protein [Candidatus Angelobacter sp.]